MEGRNLAISLAGGRIAIGVVSLLAPGFVGRTMTGRDGSEGGTRLFARMVGARDLGLGLGLLVALNRGAPVRGWLEASAVVDGIDMVACLLARDHICTHGHLGGDPHPVFLPHVWIRSSPVSLVATLLPNLVFFDLGWAGLRLKRKMVFRAALSRRGPEATSTPVTTISEPRPSSSPFVGAGATTWASSLPCLETRR